MLTYEEIKNNITPYIDEFGIKRAGVFGSVARGNATEKSDVDLIFDFQKDFGILALSRFKMELEERLGKKVDIVEFSSLDPLIADDVMKEVVYII